MKSAETRREGEVRSEQGTPTTASGEEESRSGARALRKVIERTRKLSEMEARRHGCSAPQPHSRHPDASPPTIRASNASANGSPLSLSTESRSNIMR